MAVSFFSFSSSLLLRFSFTSSYSECTFEFRIHKITQSHNSINRNDENSIYFYVLHLYSVFHHTVVVGNRSRKKRRLGKEERERKGRKKEKKEERAKKKIFANAGKMI